MAKKDYSYNKPGAYWLTTEAFPDHFKKVDRFKRPLLGVELEYNAVNYGNIAEPINALTNRFAIVKEDSSLNQGGREICSRPLDLRGHRVAWANMFQAIKEKSIKVDTGESGYNAGIHVHISHKFISTNQDVIIDFTKKLLYLFNDYKEIITIFGERGETGYNKYNPTYWSSHTGAVNYRNNTLEFRIFKSTDDYDKLLKAIDFVHLMTNWASEEFKNNKPLTSIKKFLNEIIRQRKKYPYLYAFFKTKKSEIINILKKREKNCIANGGVNIPRPPERPASYSNTCD